MSQLLQTPIIQRITTKAINTAKSTLIPHTHHLHPSLPLKLTSTLYPIHSHRFYMAVSPSLQQSSLQNYTSTCTKNISRLYARRILELAALSAATATAVAKGTIGSSDAKTVKNEAAISKPLEWSTIDLEQQRKEFGESISSLGDSRISRLWAAGSRIVNLTLLASPLTLLVPLAYVAGPKSKSNEYAWEYAVWSVEKAGPTFIKLIQWATSRSDLFPADFITQFSRLQDNTRGHSWKETEQLLKEAYGEQYRDIFEFETTTKEGNGKKDNGKKNGGYKPIGSGCVAQVYKAKLKKDTTLLPSGSDVAIKVTHPNILHKVCVDFYILNKITSFLEKIPFLNLDYLSMKDSVDQFRCIMLPQLDLRVEARNLQRFRRDFSGDPHVTFPLPISDITTNNVLVESFVHGKPILEFMKDEECSMKDRKDLASVGLETVMKMIFLNDFVHGDLHPGNILIDRNKDVYGNPLRYNMIDCGLVVEMGQKDHVNLVKILGAFIKREGTNAAELMIDTAKKCQATSLDMELFSKGIQNICDSDQDNNFLESVGDYLADICYLACKHKVKLEASFINAALACEIMEGIASKLYPTLEVQSIALPMVFKAEVMHGLKSFGL